MKYLSLVLFLISFNVLSADSYALKSSVESCDNHQVVYSGAKSYEGCSNHGDCLETEMPYNCEYVSVIDNKIVIDNVKKSLFDSKMQDKKTKIDTILDGKVKQQKCKDARAYVTGKMNSKTIEEIDAFLLNFTAIDDALTKCTIKKAIKLLGYVTDPNYMDLREKLLEILE